VLKGINKVIIDERAAAGGVVPYLPLPDLERRAREAQQHAPNPTNGGTQ
jgi:hypothetical protein